ncbi:hypothetical protein C1646_678772 [Rhizophagus diaphanus]|nr:hypothetical protein C1646_678772 [Rhizophagus diaphanus] [Rhizophagus sp. MUCL 43196]
MSNYYHSANNPITFITDEVLVRNYRKFNLTYDELINNSQKTRRAIRNKKNGTNSIPRRQNAWILYLRDKSPNMSGFSPKEIAKMWNDEPKEVVEVYEAAARLAAERHMVKYGLDYKYSPRRIRNKKPKTSKTKTSRIPVTPPTTPISNNCVQTIQFPVMTPTLEFVAATPATPPSEPDNINLLQFPNNLLQICNIIELIQNCEVCRSLLQGLYDYPYINFENPLESQNN